MPRPLTRLEAAVDAACATRLAWLFEADHGCRAAAGLACGRLGMDYVELVAKTMETHGWDPDAARYAVSRAMSVLVDQMVAGGARPVHGARADDVVAMSDPPDL